MSATQDIKNPVFHDKQDAEQEDYCRLGIAKSGDPIIVTALAAKNSDECYFIDPIKYRTLDDASKALLAYKLMFALHLTPTDRCQIAGFLRASISQASSQEIP